MLKPSKPDIERVQNPPEVVVGLDKLARKKSRLPTFSNPTLSYSDNSSSINNVLDPNRCLTSVKQQHHMDRGLCLYCGQAKYLIQACPC